MKFFDNGEPAQNGLPMQYEFSTEKICPSPSENYVR